MKLNHLDLMVRDVPGTLAYFRDFFGLSVLTKQNSRALAILGDGHGFVLVLQHAEQPVYPDGFHIGFLLDDVERVRALHARAVVAGAVVSDVISNGRGTMIYFTAPDGYRVEVSCQKQRWQREEAPR